MNNWENNNSNNFVNDPEISDVEYLFMPEDSEDVATEEKADVEVEETAIEETPEDVKAESEEEKQSESAETVEPIVAEPDVDDKGSEVEKEVVESVEFALSAPEPKPEELTKYIWA